MEGGDFSNMFDWEIRNGEVMVQNMEILAQIASKLKVLARASPFDRILFLMGLKEMGKSVAVTGFKWGGPP